MASFVLQVVTSYALNALVQAMAPAQQGPRLNDLKVQSSTYGNAIPIPYGAMRFAGNMIWSLPIKETKHRSGGKGGPKVDTYTYSQTFAVAICEGPIIGIRKIWANGELIYNVDAASATAKTLIANSQSTGVAQVALGGVSAGSGIVIYSGSETQHPDPTIQAHVGVGNTPAYRGTAYALFNDLQLDPYGNRTPNLEFEVMAVATTTGPYRIAENASTGVPFYVDHQTNVGVPVITALQNGVLRITTLNGTTTYLFDADGNYLGSEGRQDVDAYPAASGTFPYGVAPYPIGMLNGFPLVTRGIGLVVGTGVIGIGSESTGGQIGSYDLTSVLPAGEIFLGCCMASDNLRLMVFTGTSSSGDAAKWYQLSFDGANATIESSGTMGTVALQGLSIGIGSVMPYASGNSALEDDYTHFWNWWVTYPNLYTFGLYAIVDGVMTAVWVGNTSTYIAWPVPNGAMFAKGGLCWLVSFNTIQVFTRVSMLSGSSPTLGAVVADIVTRTDPLQLSDLDISQLTDVVDGYVIPNRMSAREAIQPLQQMFFFDVVESDGLLKFVKRGGAIVATIPEDDLAAHAYGQDMPDQVLTTRQQEVELPREVSVTYQAKDSSYQAGVQYSRRLITSSQLASTVNLMAALSDAKAKQIADVIEYSVWTGRNTFQFTTTRKYAWLDPSDPIQVQKGNLTYSLRLTSNDNGPGVMTWEAAMEDASVYDQQSVAATTPAPPVTIDQPGPTNLQLLDIPLLRDVDDGPGFYLAGCGYLSGWTGAQPYKSIDNGASWDAVGNAVLNAATIGTAGTVLGTFAGGNMFDEGSTVTVTVLTGTLSSTTELNVLNGANAALLGNELIQFKNATLTAANTYVLSGLLRGRKGTEWAMSSHAIGERFVLLTNTTIYRESDGTAEIGLARQYKGVSFGTSLTDSSAITFTDTGVGLKPLSPVRIGGGRDTSGNLTINWTRRTRIGAEWRDYVDASIGESSESYDVEIWTSGYGTLKRTLAALSSPTASYTSAQQITDFGANQSALAIKVYQNSATVGRGYAGQATV